MSGDRWYAAQPVIETAMDTTAKCKVHVIDATSAMGGSKCGQITIANRHTATTIIVKREKAKTAKVVAATQITLKISSTLFSLSFHALAKATFVVCKFLGALGVVNFAAFTGDVRHFRLMPRPPRTAPLSRAQSLLPFVISNLTSSTALICRKIPFCSRSSLFCLVMGGGMSARSAHGCLTSTSESALRCACIPFQRQDLGRSRITRTRLGRTDQRHSCQQYLRRLREI